MYRNTRWLIVVLLVCVLQAMAPIPVAQQAQGQFIEIAAMLGLRLVDDAIARSRNDTTSDDEMVLTSYLFQDDKNVAVSFGTTSAMVIGKVEGSSEKLLLGPDILMRPNLTNGIERMVVSSQVFPDIHFEKEDARAMAIQNRDRIIGRRSTGQYVPIAQRRQESQQGTEMDWLCPINLDGLPNGGYQIAVDAYYKNGRHVTALRKIIWIFLLDNETVKQGLNSPKVQQCLGMLGGMWSPIPVITENRPEVTNPEVISSMPGQGVPPQQIIPAPPVTPECDKNSSAAPPKVRKDKFETSPTQAPTAGDLAPVAQVFTTAATAAQAAVSAAPAGTSGYPLEKDIAASLGSAEEAILSAKARSEIERFTKAKGYTKGLLEPGYFKSPTGETLLVWYFVRDGELVEAPYYPLDYLDDAKQVLGGSRVLPTPTVSSTVCYLGNLWVGQTRHKMIGGELVGIRNRANNQYIRYVRLVEGMTAVVPIRVNSDGTDTVDLKVMEGR